MNEIVRQSLFSPLTLAFALGAGSKLMRSEMTMPRDLHQTLAIYLLLALGLKGGVELSHTSYQAIFLPALATLALGVITPISAYLVMRRAGGFSIADSAGVAAHYGSVSAVTFIAAQQFATAAGHPPEGFMPTLLTLLESPGIHIALGIGSVLLAREVRASPQSGLSGDSAAMMEPLPEGGQAGTLGALRHVLTGRTMVLLVGGLLVGWAIGEKGWRPIEPFFDGCFKGALVLFLLDMGLVAGERFGDIGKAGPFLALFGVLMPLVHGTLGVAFARWAGMSVGGAAVLGAMAASASYIAAPPAVRMTFPEANPSLYLTMALGVTFPFNIVFGIPIYHALAARWPL